MTSFQAAGLDKPHSPFCRKFLMFRSSDTSPSSCYLVNRERRTCDHRTQLLEAQSVSIWFNPICVYPPSPGMCGGSASPLLVGKTLRSPARIEALFNKRVDCCAIRSMEMRASRNRSERYARAHRFILVDDC